MYNNIDIDDPYLKFQDRPARINDSPNNKKDTLKPNSTNPEGEIEYDFLKSDANLNKLNNNSLKDNDKISKALYDQALVGGEQNIKKIGKNKMEIETKEYREFQSKDLTEGKDGASSALPDVITEKEEIIKDRELQISKLSLINQKLKAQVKELNDSLTENIAKAREKMNKPRHTETSDVMMLGNDNFSQR